MSTFTSRNGLYDRAREQFNVQDGMKLFTYSFFKQHRAKVQVRNDETSTANAKPPTARQAWAGACMQAFFAQIYSEAQASQAAPGHHALARISEMGRLQRQYTLNIDGLSEVVGLSTWHPQANPAGSTVELHGNIRQLVCPSCLSTSPLTRRAINVMKDEKVVCCPSCAAEGLRFKVMLYDDDQGACITPEHVFETLEEDLQVADCVLWVGISFEQAASVEYFRQVRQLLASLGRLTACPQVVINPSAAACANVVSSMCNLGGLQLLDVRATADTALPALAERMASRPHPTPATHLTTTTSTHPSAVSSLPSTSSPTLSAATGSPAAAPAQATTATAGRQPQPKGRPAGEAGLLQPESSNPGGPATRPALQTSSYPTSRAEALQQQQQQQQQGQGQLGWGCSSRPPLQPLQQQQQQQQQQGPRTCSSSNSPLLTPQHQNPGQVAKAGCRSPQPAPAAEGPSSKEVR
ncbi:hypothetical protein QJQ45_024632 [Haematococcus lacustris]|nr:hypothetical protein QJQ45_024632 [Haematococcus lacustris]